MKVREKYRDTEMHKEPERKRNRRTQRENTLTQAEMQRDRGTERDRDEEAEFLELQVPEGTLLSASEHAVNPLFPRVTGSGLCSLQPQEGRDPLARVLRPECPAEAPKVQECTDLDFYRVVLVEVDWRHPRDIEGSCFVREGKKEQ